MDESRGHAIRISVPTARQQTAQTAETVTLNRYYSAQNRPRPESFREDANAAAILITPMTIATKISTNENAEFLYFI